MPDTSENRLLELLADKPRPARELLQALAVSQPTLSRMVARSGSRIVTLGRSKSTCYGRPRAIRGRGSVFPVYQVDEAGDAHSFGTLTSVWERHYWWEPAVGPSHLYSSLPWFVQDMRPDGFVGRAFAQRLHHELEVPLRLQDWNDDDTLTAVIRRGEDCVGNLIAGTESLERYFRNTQSGMAPLRRVDSAGEYPRLAHEALAGDPVGSSAGGEQPKFTTLIDNAGELQHLLVKFSPDITTVEGRRWADLLICEHLALETMREAGYSAADSTIIESGNRVYLEVVRFDRVGLHGRRPLYSLGVVDDEFFGRRDSWVGVAGRLEAAKMLSRQDASALRWLALFGDLIANTDQHFGNVSLIPEDSAQRRFILAPAYDMLPMYYRLRDVASAETAYQPPSSASLTEWHSALQAAATFWARAAADGRISVEFRTICRLNRDRIISMTALPRRVA
ncbi:MAG: type II toxin-antitoxin system HipA family toxin YjjJ [Desulfuromonadaceae bacterium]